MYINTYIIYKEKKNEKRSRKQEKQTRQHQEIFLLQLVEFWTKKPVLYRKSLFSESRTRSYFLLLLVLTINFI